MAVSISSPTLVASLKVLNEKIVQIGITNSVYWKGHTFALTESNKLYAFGFGGMGQIGVNLEGHTITKTPKQLKIDLS